MSTADINIMGGGCSKEGEVPVLRDTDAENIASTSGLSRDEVDFFGTFLEYLRDGSGYY